ncbi:3-deoxy-D-manno-octulosonic acid transferase [Tropicibacter naphthalenivorans]|uniref:3-deoxy-D-manno-octulosonic acid transferase n=1 Tax=Tropicibacter naphthalenivorans TaxID=441103 RepID=A0A0P1GK00_9RHOB|nr:glycosyltransferase N-terminal domain-containing protein [Tropicibacter naphthalenivorans]CUH75792.1 3-deoxy-D-manno-octulosonic acid transferase [Tropicibacter naphthalenivorans]SMC42215.1 3-deoxy-D-manno-octulosonic-acid transferase [Tropicibacter naphthalenivorans]
MILYRLLISLFAIIAVLQGRKHGPETVKARLGRSPAQNGPHIWLHGASNGELASCWPVVQALSQARPDLKWVITSNSATGVDLARQWPLPQHTALPAPVDLARVSARVMRDWNVQAHITLETEIWPHRILSCPGPVVMLGARMSASTAKGWSRVPGLIRRTLGRVSFASAQDLQSLERLIDLGLPKSAAGPTVDLKSFHTPPDLPAAPELGLAFDRAQTWLAASTHDGEDDILLEAHKIALNSQPDLRLILAPRHPRRAADILRLCTQHGLSVAQRSAGAPPTEQVYLADTMGEMPRWYALAGRVFIGGTLTDRGGHTPYEPATFGCALIHGPDTRNFRASFDQLRQTDAAIQAATPAQIAQALAELTPTDTQEKQGRAAQEALRQDTDLAPLVDKLLQILPAG